MAYWKEWRLAGVVDNLKKLEALPPHSSRRVAAKYGGDFAELALQFLDLPAASRSEYLDTVRKLWLQAEASANR
jgi:hypothetical protein